MPRDEEKDRADPERVTDDRIDDVPRPPQVEQKGAGVEDVGEEPVQDRHPHDGMVPLHPEDVDHEGDDVSASGERHAGDDVETFPEAPGDVLRQVGDRAQAPDVSNRQQNDGAEEDEGADHVERSQDLALRPQLAEHEPGEAPDLACDAASSDACHFQRQPSPSAWSAALSSLPASSRDFASANSRGGTRVSTTGTA